MSGILGLGSSGSLELNDELLQKLREADEKSLIDPLNEDIEDKEAEIEATDEIYAKILELQTSIEKFDLYETDNNVFDSVSASTSGTSVTFDADDTSNLSPGTINVNVTQLAQKDVYQSETFTDKTAVLDAGTITITVGEGATAVSHDFTADGTTTTYEDLIEDMNYQEGIEASIEQVGDSEYRIVIKSSESGEANAVNFGSSTLATTLGFDVPANHVQDSQNFQGTIDGISYDISSNQVTLDSGLIITATDEGESSITLERDTSSIVDAVEEFASLYNELVQLVDKYGEYDEDTEKTVLSDSTTLDTILSTIKGAFYDTYGLSDEENAFKYGITFNSDGEMEVDTGELGTALTENFDDVKELFVGYAEKEGIGTFLSDYIDNLDGFEAVLSTYMDNLDDDLSELKEELEDQTEKLDKKYEAMAQQFATYTTIITQMENSFASLKILIGADDDD